MSGSTVSRLVKAWCPTTCCCRHMKDDAPTCVTQGQFSGLATTVGVPDMRAHAEEALNSCFASFAVDSSEGGISPENQRIDFPVFSSARCFTGLLK